MEMIKTKALNLALIDGLIDSLVVHRISHLFLLRDVQLSENSTWEEVRTSIIPNGIASREDNLTVDNTLTAVFSRPIEGDITGAAIIFDGNMDISQEAGTYSKEDEYGTEVVAWVLNFQPIRKPDWDDFTVKIRMF